MAGGPARRRKASRLATTTRDRRVLKKSGRIPIAKTAVKVSQSLEENLRGTQQEVGECVVCRSSGSEDKKTIRNGCLKNVYLVAPETCAEFHRVRPTEPGEIIRCFVSILGGSSRATLRAADWRVSADVEEGWTLTKGGCGIVAKSQLAWRRLVKPFVEKKLKAKK